MQISNEKKFGNFRSFQITEGLPLTPPNLLKKVIETQQEGITRISRDRFTFLSLAGVFVGFILVTFFAEQHVPGVKTAVSR